MSSVTEVMGSVRTFGAIRKGKRKYDHGESPCGRCQAGEHRHCRPRVDNTLCTCSCHSAVAYRNRVAEMQRQQPERSTEECVIEIAPAFRSSSLGGQHFAAVDRTKDNPLQNLC